MDVKSQIRDEADGVNHFARIPDDVLLSIISRLENLKYMCQCSLVSKRFALTVHQIKAVSLSLPSTEIPSDAAVRHINYLFPRLAGLTREQAIRFIQLSSIKEMKFLPFLRKFRELKSLSLEYRCASSLCSSSLFKMRVKFSRRGGVVEKFVSLVADYVLNMTGRVYNGGLEYEPQSKGSIRDTFLEFGCCSIWLLALCLLIKCHPSLEKIAITNDKKQGELVVEGEQLVAWRSSFVPGGLMHDFRSYACTRGWTSELRMPATGYLLRGVNFVVSKPERKPRSSMDDEDTITWEYQGEARLLAEAVNEHLRYDDPFLESQFAD